MLLTKQSESGVATHMRWGDLNGVEVGDVWFADKTLTQQGAVMSGKFMFARRNVLLEVSLNSSGISPYMLDLMRLARELDAQVNEQGLPGQTWPDIAEFCPKIVQFEADSLRLKAKGGLRTLIRHKVAADPEAIEILLLTACENGMRVDVHWREPYAEVPYYAPESLPSEPFTVRCWLIAVNTRNLCLPSPRSPLRSKNPEPRPLSPNHGRLSPLHRGWFFGIPSDLAGCYHSPR